MNMLQGGPSHSVLASPVSLVWHAVAAPKGMQPALQYMAGELRVERGDVLPLLATHNTVRMRFDIEEAEYPELQQLGCHIPHAALLHAG